MNLDVIRPVTGLLYDLRTGKQGLKSNIRFYFYKQSSWYGSNVKKDLKVKQLAKQPLMLKTLM